MNYKVIPRKNPRDLEADPKYYATIVRPPSITIDKLAKGLQKSPRLTNWIPNLF